MRHSLAITLSLAILFFASGALFTYRLIDNARTPAVSTETVIQALNQEGFLVTESYISEQKVTIDRGTGNPFKDFFFGQTIEAFATMKVSLGVDTRMLTPDDILFSDTWIVVRLPEIQTYSTEIIGDITLKNTEGVVKKIVDHDDGYNAAASELRLTAMQSATSDTIRAATRESTMSSVKALLKPLVGDREVVVELP